MVPALSHFVGGTRKNRGAVMEMQGKKQRVFLTGATGSMGLASLKEMLKDGDKQDIVLLIRDSVKNRKSLATFRGAAGLEIHWGI